MHMEMFRLFIPDGDWYYVEIAWRGMESAGRWRHDTHNRTFALIERFGKEDYAFLREHPAMREILAELALYAK